MSYFIPLAYEQEHSNDKFNGQAAQASRDLDICFMTVFSLPRYPIYIRDSFLAISICFYITFIFLKYKVLWNFAIFRPSGNIRS